MLPGLSGLSSPISALGRVGFCVGDIQVNVFGWKSVVLGENAIQDKSDKGRARSGVVTFTLPAAPPPVL